MLNISRRIQLVYALPIVLLITSFIFIFPFGEFAVNDDWDFITHVRNFRQGDFVKNSLIDSSFILQGFLGTIWTYIFGFSFVSLRFLTLIFTITFIVGLVKLLKLLGISKYLIVISVLTIIFNPFILLSSVTFMTEIYFLCFMTWSIVYFIKYEKSNYAKDLTISIILGSLSLLVRQIGFLLVPPILLCAFILDLSRKQLKIKNYLFLLIIFITSSAIVLLWPQYSVSQSKANQFLNQIIISIGNLRILPSLLFYMIPYIGFSLIPFGIISFSSQRLYMRIIIVILAIALFIPFYSVNIFKFGNVLYPEGLMIKNNYIHHLTFFDNLVFKSFLCSLCNLSFFSILAQLISDKAITKNRYYSILGILFLSLLIPALLYDVFYDRYIVNSLVIMVIITGFSINMTISTQISRPKLFLTSLLLIIFCLYSLSLVSDFIATTRTQWNQAELLRQYKTIGNRIFLSGTYSKYSSVYYKKNSAEITEALPPGLSYKCYVQRDVNQHWNNPIYHFLNKINNSSTLNKYLQNPKIFGEKTMPGFRPPTRDQGKILYAENIFSIPEFLVGNDVFVITYCNN